MKPRKNFPHHVSSSLACLGLGAHILGGICFFAPISAIAQEVNQELARESSITTEPLPPMGSPVPMANTENNNAPETAPAIDNASLSASSAEPSLAQIPYDPTTPYLNAGESYPTILPPDHDSNLVHYKVQSAPAAKGTPTWINGFVTTREGTPVAGAVVEIWQTDTIGRFHHDGNRNIQEIGFQGFGRTKTDEKGFYQFRTIRPVPSNNRAPYLHMAVWEEGQEPFFTQLFFLHEPLNASDPVLNSLAIGDQAKLLVELLPAPSLEKNSLGGSFNVVLW
ncbi:MAG: hypothetical protein ACOYK8_00255 [Alphaproteobacteria bacterium]